MPFSLANSFLAILMLISRKPVQRNGISEKRVFSLLADHHQSFGIWLSLPLPNIE